MPESSDKKTVIVIGDWYIDESWHVSRQKIYHSSHTGDIHYQSRHSTVTEPIVSLCGAAALLEVLRTYFNNNDDCSYKFIGVGSWNHNDDDLIRCVLCNKYREKMLLTPFTLASLKEIEKLKGTNSNNVNCPYPNKSKYCDYDIDLINLVNQGKSNEVSTNRIIRCYEGFGGEGLRLLYRFDWILPITNNLLNVGNLDLAAIPQNITAIVIEDHGLGVINDECVGKLIEKACGEGGTEWYIRTKIDNPPWMKKLKDKGIKPRLIVSDSQLAIYKKGDRLWRYGKWLSRAALELLGEMTGDKIYRHQGEIKPDSPEAQCAAVLLDDNTVFAKDNNDCFAINKPPGPKQLINIGRTTIFYAALIAQVLQERDKKKSKFGTQCGQALDCAYEWSKGVSDLWKKSETFFYRNYTKALNKLNEKSSIVADKSEFLYDKLWALWNESSIDLGIVNVGDNGNKKRVLQLWRGEGTVPGYICVGGKKRDAINQLVSSIAAFKRDAVFERDKVPSHPLSCLLISSPGWGKSFLANCLAKHFDMEYLEFSIAQMATSRDLLDSLTRIASVQNRVQKMTLVFIDEVNAEIEGNSVMSLLLSPIWDKMITVEGINYRLKPGVWVFASTYPVKVPQDQTNKREDIISLTKGSDFVSRLNGPIIDLDLLGGEYTTKAISSVRNKLNTMVGMDIDEYKRIYTEDSYNQFLNDTKAVLKTEQVYLMVSLLSEQWGPIRRVQECVLQLFHDILPVNGLRSLKFFASSFKDVKGGEVVVSNVPEVEDREELRRHVILPQKWLVSEERKKHYKDPRDDKAFVYIEKLIN